MKKFLAFAVLLITVLIVLCGCIPQPFAKQIIQSNNGVTTDHLNTDDNDNPLGKPTRRLYVSGAVKFDGYITVPEICDYKTVLQICGITGFSAITNDLNEFLNDNIQFCIVDFTFDNKVCTSVNVNGAVVINRLDIDGVDSAVVNKLADYINFNGVITNRVQLMSALGDDYIDNYYKFYIDIADYA